MLPTTPTQEAAVDYSSSSPLRTAGSLGEELERAQRILMLVREVLGRDAPVEVRVPANVDEADAALSLAGDALIRRGGETASKAEIARIFELFQKISYARIMLREAELAQRSASIAGIGRALDALRTVGSVTDLVSRAPTQVGELGYQRCMLSRVESNRWVAKSCYVQNDAELAAEILAVGSHSRALGHRLVESEILRRRSPVLVSRAQDDARVDPGFKRVTSTSSYVAAPIMVGPRVFGFVHADSPSDGREVGEFDRALVRTFSESLGYALERLFYQERLQTIRQQVTHLINGPQDVLDEMTSSSDEETSVSADIPPGRSQAIRSGMAEVLTRRELEVLACIAEGNSNTRIANRLFVSDATVKAHVRSILRKLGVANRAEAVSHYLRAA